MSRNLMSSEGTPLLLGLELGKGGEGSVFEVPSRPTQVAKLYHKPIGEKKQAKLAFMVSAGDEQLLKYVAWPQDTLHSTKAGPIIGFLMPKLEARDAVHRVYSPAHRKQDRPKAAWDFLLYVARNTAAAFEALHHRGHVLGDVNQGNVLVSYDSTVVLIDSDSFQVKSKGIWHLCEVGVAHFTPPELQGTSRFDTVVRTSNHDNFGLALLIFHLLFGGRHPYSGVPLREGVGDALESDIKGFRYAYARDSQRRGLAPPPRSIPLSILPEPIERMFFHAFTEAGATSARPTAKQWVAALDAIRGELAPCKQSATHLYPNRLRQCPWCALEQQGAVYFLNAGATLAPPGSPFVLAQTWAAIEAVPVPPPITVPTIDINSLIAHPLPSNIAGRWTINFYRLLAVVVAVGLMAVLSEAWGYGILAGLVGWFIASNAGSADKEAELSKRKAAFVTAKAGWNLVLEEAKAIKSSFTTKKAELTKLREEYLSLPQGEHDEMAKLRTTAHQRQKHKFLETCFIDSATIPDIGPSRKAALRSFGIETAADLSRQRIQQVRGFGEGLTQALLAWRTSCESRFSFKNSVAVSEADLDIVRVKFAARKSAIEASLSNGVLELKSLRQKEIAMAALFRPKLDAATKRLSQAERDLSIF